VMGWDVRAEGLKVIFSRDIPTIVHAKIPTEADAFFTKLGLSRAEHLLRFIAHPGGMKVLAAYQDALSLPPERLNHARDVLRTHGNMSSCTVYFVLERELADEHQRGEHGLLLALGPGFSCEQVMLRW
jgi:alkylresorcinol/alkylpyrone synthase